MYNQKFVTNKTCVYMWFQPYHSFNNCDTLFSHWGKIQQYQHNSCLYSIKSQPGYLQLPSDAWQVTAGFPLFLINTGSASCLLHNITLLKLRMNPYPIFKGSNSNFCARLLREELDALLVLQFSNLHWLLCGHRIPDCLGVRFTLNLLQKGCYFRLSWQTSGLCSTERLHNIALLHDYLTKIRHYGIKIFAILLCLGLDNNNCGLLLSTLNSLEKGADVSAIINTTVTMICRALHNHVLFIV